MAIDAAFFGSLINERCGIDDGYCEGCGGHRTGFSDDGEPLGCPNPQCWSNRMANAIDEALRPPRDTQKLAKKFVAEFLWKPHTHANADDDQMVLEERVAEFIRREMR